MFSILEANTAPKWRITLVLIKALLTELWTWSLKLLQTSSPNRCAAGTDSTWPCPLLGNIFKFYPNIWLFGSYILISISPWTPGLLSVLISYPIIQLCGAHSGICSSRWSVIDRHLGFYISQITANVIVQPRNKATAAVNHGLLTLYLPQARWHPFQSHEYRLQASFFRYIVP